MRGALYEEGGEKRRLENIKISGLEKLINPLVKKSNDAAEDFTQPIELLWIDGSHDFDDVFNDFLLWFPKIVNGGWVAFHDSKWPGVRKVLWESLYPSRQVGLIRRIEDTTFAKKVERNSLFIYFCNLFTLTIYQLRQKIKRGRRRRKKRIRAKKADRLTSPV